MGDFSFDTKENSEILRKSISKTREFATFSNRFKMLEKDPNNTEAVTWFKNFFEFVKNSAKEEEFLETLKSDQPVSIRLGPLDRQ